MDQPLNLLITAGPTREPIDAVRFISNRSSGAMGLALAEAAAAAGHAVTLLLGPVLSPTTLHDRVAVHRFTTTAELQHLLGEHFLGRRDTDAADAPFADVLVMAAAVADYRAADVAPGKTPRGDRLRIELEATPDLVAQCAAAKRPGQRVVAFALEEDEHLEARAAAKMKRKGVDAIVANPLGTMEGDAIRSMLLTADGRRLRPDDRPVSKPAFAAWLIDAIERGEV
ncbi:MAG: phosphopantothenoylcysteine decarboxylase [Planctomycetota bacterium]